MSKTIEILIDEESECFHDDDGSLAGVRLDSLEKRVDVLEDFTQVTEENVIPDLAALFILKSS